MVKMKARLRMTARIHRAYYDVCPPGEATPSGMKCVCLTMRSDSPFYERERWVDREGYEMMMTAYTVLPDNFEAQACKETGLNIGEYDTHYVLQFIVNFDKHPTASKLKSVQLKLERFVEKHFKLYVPETKAA